MLTRPEPRPDGRGISFVEWRDARRHTILQRCFVRPAGDDLPEPWRGVAYDISASGIGLALTFDASRGAILAIRAWDLPGARPLLVRVVQNRQANGFWATGCVLVERLSDRDLSVWRSGPVDWPDRDAPGGG